MADENVAPLYSVWQNKKSNGYITILGYTNVPALKPSSYCLIVGSAKKRSNLTITPEQLLSGFNKIS